jgi:hypothetical protein
VKTSEITDAQVVDACRRSHDSDFLEGRADEILIRETGAPLKVVMRAMERANRRNLIEYGVSLRTAWPTPADEPLPFTVEPPRLSLNQFLDALHSRGVKQ